jgi:hypothetical protein
MTQQTLPGGVVHRMPADLQKAILSNKQVLALWQDITPLARNEWICWIENAVKADTRQRRIAVGMSKMKSGMRRPCCWVGCIHRSDKPLSPSAKWVLAKQSKARQ